MVILFHLLESGFINSQYFRSIAVQYMYNPVKYMNSFFNLPLNQHS